jgi:hypothetical protein
LYTKVILKDDGKLKTTVYRKATHTDQYLSFGSNHHLQHKRSVVRTLLHRVNNIVTEEEDQETERNRWMLKPPKPKKPKEPNTNRTTKSRSFPLPYVRGVSESLAKIFRRHGVGTYFKPYNTLRQQLVNLKDKTPDEKKCGVIYQLTCEQCDKQYVGETARAFGTRLKEHQRKKGPQTAVGEHLQNTGQNINEENNKIIAREDSFWPRKIREAIEIRIRSPTLNRDQGYNLPPHLQHPPTGDLGPRSPDRKA